MLRYCAPQAILYFFHSAFENSPKYGRFPRIPLVLAIQNLLIAAAIWRIFFRVIVPRSALLVHNSFFTIRHSLHGCQPSAYPPIGERPKLPYFFAGRY
jgi:hypothetical protein